MEVVVRDVAESGRDAAGQLVVAQKQVSQISQVAQRRRYLTGQLVVAEFQLLKAVEPSQIRWYRAGEERAGVGDAHFHRERSCRSRAGGQGERHQLTFPYRSSQWTIGDHSMNGSTLAQHT